MNTKRMSFGKVGFAVAVGFTLTVAAEPAFAGKKKDPVHQLVTAPTAEQMLLEGSKGAIQYSPAMEEHKSSLVFRLTPTPATLITEGENRKNSKFNQLLFQLDVAKFIANEGTEDFVSAKQSYFSRLNFNLKDQRHDRPYPYLADWRSLNHPPIRELTLPLETYLKPMKNEAVDTSSKLFDPSFQKEIDDISQTELTRGNKLTALPNGTSHIEKIKQVKNAKKFIFAAVMAWQCNEHTLPLMDAMIEKVKEGVDVRVMMEKFYADTVFRKCYKYMRDGGIDVVRVTDKFKYWLTFMHNKFFVFDGTTGIIGGQNIARFQTMSDGFNHYNRDTDLLIEGPAATDLLATFVELWETTVNRRAVSRRKHETAYPYMALVNELKSKQVYEGKRGHVHYGDWFSTPAKRMDGVCRVTIQKPYGRNFFITDVYRKYFEATKRNVIMTSPDMHFDEDGASKIKNPKATEFYQFAREAALRGVRIDHISNGRDGGWGEFTAQLRDLSDQKEQQGKHGQARMWARREERQSVKMIAATRELMKMLAKTPNFNAWTNFQYIHAKQVLWDSIAVAIGSVNLDTTALDRNHEGAAICMDESLVEQMRHLMTRDLVNSVPVVSKNGH